MYYVIEFETGEIEVVPCSWVKDGQVLWKSGISGIYAKKNIQPKSSWTKYKCTVRYRNQQYTTYEEALEKCKFILEHTDSSDVDGETRTRKPTQNPDYQYFRDSEVDELPEFPGSEVAATTKTISAISRSSSVSERVDENEMSEERSNGTPTPSEMVSKNFHIQPIVEILPISITDEISDLTFSSCKCDDTKKAIREEIDIVSNSIMGEIITIKREIKQLIEAVKLNTSTLEKFIIQSKREWEAIKLDVQRPREENRVLNEECELLFHSILPLAKIEDVETVNILLIEEDNKTFFINKMRRIGGKDARSNLNNMVKFCFTLDIQKKCNWSGANEKCRLKGSNIAKLLMDILVQDQNCTYEAAEGHMKYIFQHTYDRQKQMVNEKNKKK